MYCFSCFKTPKSFVSKDNTEFYQHKFMYHHGFHVSNHENHDDT